MTDENGTGRRERQKRRAGRDRVDILNAASDVIAERGFYGARFSDIADRAGTSISTLQYLFGSREDLVVAAAMRHVDLYYDECGAESRAIADPLERLRWTARDLAADTFAGDDQDERVREWTLWVEVWHAALRDDELSDVVLTALSKWSALTEAAIAYAVDQGAIAPPTDLDFITEGLTAMANGLGIQIAISHGRLSAAAAGNIILQWLALALNCPELLDK